MNVYYDGDKKKYSFEINGKRVCQKGWYKSLGISNGWLVTYTLCYRVRTEVSSGY